LMSEFWGRGLATELARESLRVAFDVVGVDSMVSFTLPTNRASQRVMEKVGFVYERDGVWADLPHVFYRLTRERWQHLAGAHTGARS
jgi:[ribosomal protein S5]-alanine N-acetyltransferase